MNASIHTPPEASPPEAECRAVNWQDKLIVGMTLAHVVIGVIWNAVVVSRLGFVTEFHLANVALAALGAAAGFGWLKQRRWAGYLILAFYLMQLVHIQTYVFAWSANLAFNQQLSFGWSERGWLGDSELGVDMFAMVMFLWCAFRFMSPRNAFSPNQLRASN